MSSIGASDIKVTGDTSGLIRALEKARSEARLFVREVNSNVSQAYKAAGQSQREFRGGLLQLGNDIQDFSKKAMLLGTLPALLSVGTFFKDYADIQKMEIGLNRFGSTLEEVRELAKLPNIGIFDSGKALVGLRATGLQGDMATRAIKSFANALTEAGKSAVDLEPALYNLQQFMSTRHINQVDLRQLGNRIPQTMQVLQNAFGTKDVEQLNKIPIEQFVEKFITELEKIPPVAGGAGMAIEQLGDSAKFFSASMGSEIDKAFNVTSKIKGLGDMLDNLAENFSTLDPEMKKTILTLGGMAVILPVLTTGIGALVKFLPILATGFGLISWPVAAIAAVTAGVIGLTAVMPLLNNKTAELKSQIEQIGSSNTKLDPLIKKYDELKGKTELNSKEKEELKKVINDLGGVLPQVAYEFDKYGNVLQVDIDKTRELAKEQRFLLEELKKTRAESLKKDSSLLQSRQSTLQQNLNAGEVREWVGDASGGMYRTRKIRQDEIKSYREELSQIGKQLGELRIEGMKMSGQTAGSRFGLLKFGVDPEKVIDDTTKTIDSLDDLSDSYSNLNKRLKELDWVQKELDKIDEAGRWERVIKQVKSATDEYKKLVGVVAGLNAPRLSSVADKESGTPGLINSSQRRQDNSKDLYSRSLDGMKEIVEQSKSLDNDYAKKVKKVVEANQELTQSINETFKNVAVDMGVGIGEMLGNLATATDGLSGFGKRLGEVMAGLMKQMGKSMIAFGASGIALKSFMKNPYLAIAAGAGMIALAQIMQNTMTGQVNSATKTARLAKGGSVGREMQVIVGDNPNAHFDNEIIAPMSKVDGLINKSMQEAVYKNGGVGGGFEIGEVRLSGEDIYLAVRRVEKRKRAIG